MFGLFRKKKEAEEINKFDVERNEFISKMHQIKESVQAIREENKQTTAEYEKMFKEVDELLVENARINNDFFITILSI